MTTVTGLFDTPADAQSAVRELIHAGWRREEIGLVTASTGDGRFWAAVKLKKL